MFYFPRDLGSDCEIDLQKAVTMTKSVPARSPMVDTPLSQLSELFKTLPVCFVSIKRSNWQVAEHADTELRVGDIVTIMYNQSDYRRIMEIFGFDEVELLIKVNPDDLAALKRIAA